MINKEQALTRVPCSYAKNLFRNLMICSKPSLSSMVIITYGMGAFLAFPGPIGFSYLNFFVSYIGLTLLVAGANICNCWLEKDVDPFMDRTKNRPLVTGSMSSTEAFWGFIIFTLLGLVIIYKCSNPMTFTLGLIAHLSYVLFYTPMKRLSTSSLFIGAIPGALPPMMGWTAVQNSLSVTAWILFWILFLWQLPHFISIAIYRRDEYEKAGLKTLPLKIGNAPAKWHMLLYTGLLVSVSFLPYFLNLAGIFYMSAALLVGAGFLWFCWESLGENIESSLRIRRVFFASLIYLPATLGVWAVEGLLRKM